MIATYIKGITGNQGDQELYRLSEPLEGHTRVVVSAINNAFGHETYIFGANSAGVILDWSELDGSYRGGTDHATALGNAGYSVVKP